MARKCFISFKTEDEKYKIEIQKNPLIDIIDYSLDESINADDEDYIIRKLREDFISKATVLIHLIGKRSGEILGHDEQKYIKRELQAALFDGEYNTKSGILGIVLPVMYDNIFGETIICPNCNNTHKIVNINNYTTIKEFSYNYYIPNDKCAWEYDDHYCVLAKWDDFIKNPDIYIEAAYDKRSQAISYKTKVRP